MNCAICLEILDSEISTTSCNHKFHKECLKNGINFREMDIITGGESVHYVEEIHLMMQILK